MTPDREALLRTRLESLDLPTKVRLLTGRDTWTLHDVGSIGLAPLVLSDGPAGVRGTRSDERDPSLCIPNATTLAASWDPEVARAAGTLVGADARRKGVHVLLAPTVNLQRSPLGGRNFEMWSEDPLLTGRMAAAFVDGVQSQGVAATAKHFVLNDTETERMTYEARVDADVLRELYLRPFEDLVHAGVWVVMAAYPKESGIHLTAHEPLLRGVLKGEWGFDGVVVSDWFATQGTEGPATAGLDLAMPGPDSPWGDELVTAVRQGRVDEEVVDDKVRRLLRLAVRTGALADVPVSPPDPAPLDGAGPRVRDVAARGMVLLRNDGVLPLPTDGTVALIGEPAASVAIQGGGSAHVEPWYVRQPIDAFRTALGADRVRHAPGPGVSRTLPALPLELATDPVDGAPGMRLELLDGDGRVVSAEHRAVTGLPPLTEVPSQVQVVRARFQLSVEDTGPHELSVAAAARTRVLLDGVELVDVDLSSDADLIDVVMRPPEHRFDAPLAAGQAAELVVEAEMPAADPATFAVLRLGYRRGGTDDEARIDEAVAAARSADTAVVLVGTSEAVESEGFDRTDLRLPGRQDDLVTAVATANPRTVVVVNTGSVYELAWAEDVGAILWAGLPGQEAGAALADVLTGVVEPGGRLPTTMPTSLADAPPVTTQPIDGVLDYAEGRAVGYRGYDAAGASPRYPFGHGLGYTSWDYEEAWFADAGASLRVRVRNTGERAGREVVQVYHRADDEPPRLVGFATVSLAAGETAEVAVPLDGRAASRWDRRAGRWSPLLGGELAVGRSLGDTRLVIPATQVVGRA